MNGRAQTQWVWFWAQDHRKLGQSASSIQHHMLLHHTLTHTHTHPDTHTDSHTHAHIHSHTHTQTLILMHIYSQTHTHTPTHTHTHTQTLILMHIYSQTHTHTHTHTHHNTHTHTQTLILMHIYTHTHTHTHTLMHIYTHSHTHINAHIHTFSHTHMHTLSHTHTLRLSFPHTPFTHSRVNLMKTCSTPKSQEMMFVWRTWSLFQDHYYYFTSWHCFHVKKMFKSPILIILMYKKIPTKNSKYQHQQNQTCANKELSVRWRPGAC